MANKKLKFILNILLVILLLSGGVVFGITYNKWFSGREETSAKTEFNPDIDPNAVDWVGEITSESTNKQTGGIAIPGYKSIPLRADQLEQQVNFMNPEVNSCYFVLTLIMSDGTEL